MSKCTVTFKINAVDGTSYEIPVEVPNVADITLEEALLYMLKNSKEQYQDLVNSLNKNKAAQVLLDLSDFNQKIPIGNYTINTLTSVISNSNIEYLKSRLQQLGINIDLQNILLTDMSYARGTYNKIGYYEKNGLSITLIAPSSANVEAFLKELIVESIVSNLELNEKEELLGLIETILKDVTSERAVSNINKSENPIKEFVRYYYFSSRFNNALYKSGHLKQIKDLFNSYIDVNTMYSRQYEDPLVQEFAETIEDNSISIKYLKELESTLGTSSPIETILAINNKISKGYYFDIKFIGKEKVLFTRIKKKPIFEFDTINSEYFGELINPVMSINGFNIVEYKNSYYVSEYILNNTEDLPDLKFSSLDKAKGFIDFNLKANKLSQTRLSNKVKFSSNIIESRRKVRIGDRFTALDIKLTEKPLTAADTKLLNMSYMLFHEEMDSSKLWIPVNERLTLEGLSIHTILDTPEKIETFILLRALLRNKNLYQTVYDNKSPRIDTPEKIEFEYDLSKKALEKISKAKTNLYEITGKQNSKLQISKVKIDKNIPLFKKRQRSFKSELVEIANYLNKNFGVSVELLTSAEINESLKEKVGDAGKIRAFILDNKIYVNVDNATIEDPIHEFSHIIMGTIKVKHPELYYTLVSKIEELPDYNDRLKYYTQDKRARADINEEIFVKVFAEYFTQGKNKWFQEKFDILQLSKLYKEGTRKVFQTNDETLNEKTGVIMNMSIEELLSEFGSTLLQKDEDLFDLNISSQSRTIANLVLKLLDSGKLLEVCE